MRERPDIVIATSENEAKKLGKQFSSQIKVFELKDEEQRFDDTDDLQGPRVAVGGTFDRLHAGHRLLLAATAFTATERIYIGIAGDALLKNKEHKHLLQSFDERVQAVLNFMHRATAVPIEISALLDPRKPPKAATDASIDRLVVSHETLPGAEKLATMRRQNGIVEPLHFITVGLIDDPLSSYTTTSSSSSSSDNNNNNSTTTHQTNKLSSTAIRARLVEKMQHEEEEKRREREGK